MKKRMLNLLVITSVAVFSACKGNRSGYEEADVSTSASSTDSTSITENKALANNADTAQSKLKLVKTAEMQFKVKDVLKSSEAITGLVTQYHGMVMNHHLLTNVDNTQQMPKSTDSVQQVSAFTTTDEMVVRVPQEQLINFMTQVSHLSVQVTLMRMDVDDRTIDYQAAKLKAKNRSEVEVYQQKAKPTTINAAELLALKDDKVDKQINNLRTDAEIKYSTVSLSFTQNPGISRQIVPNTDLSAYNLPVASRLGLAIANGWDVFVQMIIVLANLWMFLLLALIGWLGYRYYRKRQHKALVTNS